MSTFLKRVNHGLNGVGDAADKSVGSIGRKIDKVNAIAKPVNETVDAVGGDINKAIYGDRNGIRKAEKPAEPSSSPKGSESSKPEPVQQSATA
eukprot:TRINITY_DN105_c0_g1_i1.p2 TRINITY_DN105_c0_g1~~TRINITY_DN105_c0_g1_i1.p2  ORF type:complete len:108 (-),score=21.72 TRINITY_DN105_c0_g1_i1:46-324(-)